MNWTPDGLCADYRPVVELMNQVMLVQRQTGDNPIVIHCRLVSIHMAWPPQSVGACVAVTALAG